jgi:hypothetical protein
MMPYSLVDVYRLFGGRTASIIMVEDLSSALKIEAVHSSETSVNIYQTTWCRIPGYSNVHSNRLAPPSLVNVKCE